ncbi:uncharacterized protein LOC126184405 [Schistocerca cancellata]|uniref:uncharacterized protein LOC126184405 n=1 Tax=Schistocerca cancellata TaxID=274614 RepID=UPI00211914CB|nr:uncharacterized protein LOC126184405 [Schistocerca cancellata]
MAADAVAEAGRSCNRLHSIMAADGVAEAANWPIPLQKGVGVQAAPRRVLDSILFGSQHWDSDLARSRLHQVTAQTDVAEQEVYIGAITRRSVVSARIWMRLGACWLAAAAPMSTTIAPPSLTPSRLTRALVWSCWLVCPADGGSQLQWLLHTDPKVRVPLAMVHAATPAAMLRYAYNLRSYLC